LAAVEQGFEPIKFGAVETCKKIVRERVQKKVDLLNAGAPGANSAFWRRATGSMRRTASEVLWVRSLMCARSVTGGSTRFMWRHEQIWFGTPRILVPRWGD
jgi:hypothetical protein